jgi:hypothetical protein
VKAGKVVLHRLRVCLDEGVKFGSTVTLSFVFSN